ncbi:MAG: VWA domain-containing protein [Acidobacteria bacterium]|nr:VWA domain-containing protein [Acidobacteriota bacterium]MYJ03205.1 VWA domain-containing protein [Acidobacteriota bacterium]
MRYRYTRYTGDPFGAIDIDELVSKLSRLLLSSGFDSPYGPHDPYGEDRDDRTVQSLHDAILDALLRDGLLSDEAVERLLGDPADADQAEGRSQLEALVEELIRQMAAQGYITLDSDAERTEAPGAGGGLGPDQDPGQARFEVTDKSLDFLGYRALRDLLGSTGRASVGRHDTREMATGVEAGGASKQYEFGDTLNLDASGTILNAVQRTATPAGSAAGASGAGSRSGAPTGAAGDPAIDVRYEDLMVSQGEYQSSCATVLMLDCSHSMILYGEDRFTPAKQVALALSHLIRSQFPGDALNAVLFHDSAEEIPVKQLARVRVGPYYTNTREGLRLARRLLERQRKDMRQIVMITDGKPSALTQENGRIYRNAFGLDPMIIRETFAEVANCRRAGIMINTFMLARDYDLVSFVRRVAAICRGKAYFTTPYTLGRYVLMDYMDRKTKTVH